MDGPARRVRHVRLGARAGRPPVRRAPSGVHRSDRYGRPFPRRHGVVPRPRRRLPESRFGSRRPRRAVAARRGAARPGQAAARAVFPGARRACGAGQPPRPRHRARAVGDRRLARRRLRDPGAGSARPDAAQAGRRSGDPRHPGGGQAMRLSRLELSGVKSFAGLAELPLGAGGAAIVGPNGWGKSNISDAVRWVLGGQSPRLLRGGKMEDVIFQGSTGRRPVNVAEVSLVFDNGDGSLPLAYQEVVVTRRLSRSGQSEYLLNRSAVRPRDIQDLLRGTGLGADAAVVMEARMIEALLSEKAEERRSLFEGAAGLGLYRGRKRGSERRGAGTR